MNASFATNDPFSASGLSARKTLVKASKKSVAANTVLFETGSPIPQKDASTQPESIDDRKVRELSADDFFDLGEFRI